MAAWCVCCALIRNYVLVITIYYYCYVWFVNIRVFPDEEEGDIERLRSILAQLEFQYLVECWEKKGVPFKSHLHIPEVHPVTNALFCEREDEGHVLKVQTLCPCTDYIIIHSERHVLYNHVHIQNFSYI